MPPRPPLDDNTRFLWQCLLSSDYKNIDFPSVARAFGLNTPAARMRYTRLKRQLEAEEAEEARLAGYPYLPTVNLPIIKPRKKRKNTDDRDGESSGGGARVKNENRDRDGSGEAEDGEEQGKRWVKREPGSGDGEELNGGGDDEDGAEEEETLLKRKFKREAERGGAEEPNGRGDGQYGAEEKEAALKKVKRENIEDGMPGHEEVYRPHAYATERTDYDSDEEAMAQKRTALMTIKEEPNMEDGKW